MIVCILCSERLDRPGHHGLEYGICRVCETLNLPLNQDPPDIGWRFTGYDDSDPQASLGSVSV
jgi:hypothetical protein